MSMRESLSCHPCTGTGTQALVGIQGTPVLPHLGGDNTCFESGRKDFALPPPTSRARYPHKKGLGGRAPAYVIRCH